MRRRAYLASLGVTLVAGCPTDGSTTPAEKPPGGTSTGGNDADGETGDGEEETSSSSSTQDLDPIEATILSPEQFPQGGTAYVMVRLQNEGEQVEEYDVDIKLDDDVLENVAGELAGTSSGGTSTRELYELTMTFDERGTSTISVGSERREVDVIEAIHECAGVGVTAANSNRVKSSYGPVDELTTKWSVALDDDDIEYLGRPAIQDETLFACEFRENERVTLRAFDFHTGEKRWKRGLADADMDGYVSDFGPNDLVPGVVVRDDQIYVSDVDLHVISTDGELLWEFKQDTYLSWGYHQNIPLVLSDRVVTYSVGEGVYALDKESGDQLWHADDTFADSRPAADDDRIYCVGREENEVAEDVYTRAIDRESGDVIWEYELEIEEYVVDERDNSWHSAVSYTPPLVNENRVYLGTAHYHDEHGEPVEKGYNMHLIVLDRESGEVVETVSSEDEYNKNWTVSGRLLGIETPLIDIGEGAYFQTHGGETGYWSPDSENPIFRSSGFKRPRDVIGAANGRYVIGNQEALLDAPARADFKKLEYDTNLGGVNGVAVAESHIAMTGSDGLVVFSD